MTDVSRLGIFAHFDRHDKVAEYVIYSIQSMAKHVDNLVFVTTSKLSESDRNCLEKICGEVISRENIGHDLYSYRVGLESVDWSDYREVVLFNDSVYGPMTDLGKLFKTMGAKGYDFWGVSDNYDIAYHVQSYFLVFSEVVLRSTVFENFWENMIILGDKDAVINEYEVGLSQVLVNSGFSCGSLYPAKEMDALERLLRFPRHYWKMFTRRWRDIALYKSFLKGIGNKAGVNPTHYQWKDMVVSKRAPYLKVGLLRDNPQNLPDIGAALSVIAEHTDYPVELIRTHLQGTGR